MSATLAAMKASHTALIPPPLPQVLAEELEHTSATLAAMEASHTALGRTRDEYHGQHRKLRQSKGLLGTLNWQAKSVSRGLGWGGVEKHEVVGLAGRVRHRVSA